MRTLGAHHSFDLMHAFHQSDGRAAGSRLTPIDHGCLETIADRPLAARLLLIHQGIATACFVVHYGADVRFAGHHA